MVQALIPEGLPYQGMFVRACDTPPDVDGYEVWLELEDDRELVGAKALLATLEDWQESETGDLPAMVEAAATKLAKRRAQARGEE
jgi:hypothetical protein